VSFSAHVYECRDVVNNKLTLSPKKCIQTINVAKTATDRQEEGARIINMCFANAPVAVAA